MNDPAAVERELMRLEDGAMERWRRGDPMGWAEIAAPEVTYVDPGLTRPIVGLEEYTRYLEGLKGKIHYDGSDFMQPKAAVYGDVAILTFTYRGYTKKPDGSVEWNLAWNTTEVYARQDGRWKIIHTHWSYVRHDAPDRVDVPVPVVRVPQEPAGVLGELMKLESAGMERYRKGDPLAFCAISLPSVTYFDSGTPRRVEGLASLKEEMAKQAGQTSYDVMEFIEPIVQVHGGTAVLFYRFFSTSLRPDGSTADRQAWNCTEVFTKADGQWWIAHTHWSLIGGQPAPRATAGPETDPV
ncbi:MAG: nuclear transport factor 2 family protein [Acidobacteriota bacterium]